MQNEEVDVIFATKKSKVDSIFQGILDTCLRGIAEGAGLEALQFNHRELTEYLFETKHKNYRVKEQHFVNGKTLSELFVSSIFAKYVTLNCGIGDMVALALPRQEEGTDVVLAMYTSNENDIKRPHLKDGDLQLRLQVKEDIEYVSRDKIMPLQPNDYSKIQRYAEQYPRTDVVVYSRRFTTLNLDALMPILLDKPNLHVIFVPDSDSSYTNRQGIKVYPFRGAGVYHFALLNKSTVQNPNVPWSHITFSKPEIRVDKMT